MDGNKADIFYLACVNKLLAYPRANADIPLFLTGIQVQVNSQETCVL
jgi:hypothetical protein